MRFSRTAEQQEQDELLALRLTAGALTSSDALTEQQRRYGVCSVSDCDLPIMGQCDDCGAALCQSCLTRHALRGCPWRQRIVDADPPHLRALEDAEDPEPETGEEGQA